MTQIKRPGYLSQVTPFQAVEVFQAAGVLEAAGRDIVHLEFGEPDFPTPGVVVDAAERALRAGQTHYTHSFGILSLREAICAHYEARYGVAVHPDQVVVSMGTSVLMQLLMLLLLEPGDEVILPDPTYACYANFVLAAGGVPVYVDVLESEGYQLDPARVAERITPRTRALMVCSPSNPTGVVLKPDVLARLVGLGVPVISDEIYHGLTYGGGETTALSFGENVFVLNGFSKYYAMTGWRLGYMIFPKQVAGDVMMLHQSMVISAAEFVQYAGLAALTEAGPVCEGYKAEYDKRRVYMIDRLASIGLPLAYEPTGAFYCFANASAYNKDSLALAMDILNKAGLALTPGIDFGPGGESHLRFSYANSLPNITEGLDRLEQYLKAI